MPRSKSKWSVGTSQHHEIVADVARKTGVTRETARKIIFTYLTIVRAHLIRRLQTHIPYLGKFTIKKLPARLIVQPNGNKLWVKDRFSPKFVFTQELKGILKRVPVEGEDDEEILDDSHLPY